MNDAIATTREAAEAVLSHLTAQPAHVQQALGWRVRQVSRACDEVARNDVDALETLTGALTALASRLRLLVPGARSDGLSETLVAARDDVRAALGTVPTPRDDAPVPIALSGGEPALFAVPITPPHPRAPADDAMEELPSWIVPSREVDVSRGLRIAAHLLEEEPRRPLVIRHRPEEPGEDVADTVGRAGEHAQLRALARDCIEELGALGQLRRRGPDDRMTPSHARFERRLLADLDALMALGRGPGSHIDVIATLLQYAGDAFTEDHVRAFARTFVLACTTDGVRVALSAMRRAPARLLDTHADALALASSPAIDGEIAELARDPDERVCAAALDVAYRRAAAPLPMLVPLATHPSEAVRAQVARCLTVAGPRDACMQILDRMLARELDDEVLVALITALATIDRSRGHKQLRKRIDAELDKPGTLRRDAMSELVVLLALLGSPRDVERLQRAVDVSEDHLEALGWHGFPQHVPRLLDALPASAPALARISGPLDTDPDREDPFEEPVAAPDAYRRWWNDDAERLGETRQRHGAPHLLNAAIAELLRDEVRERNRERCALEIALHSDRRIDPATWLARQRRQLEELRMTGG